MGGGNGQKSAMARLRKQEKDKKLAGGKSQLADNAKALTIICNICRTAFMCNTPPAKLKQHCPYSIMMLPVQEHSDSKHAKNTFADCFPSITS